MIKAFVQAVEHPFLVDLVCSVMQSLQATYHSFATTLRRQWQNVNLLSPVFLEHVPGDAVEVAARIAYVTRRDFRCLPDNSVYRFVSKVFGNRTSSPRKETYELAPDSLMFLASTVAVVVEPGQHVVECVFG
jgi:hypothetical protein